MRAIVFLMVSILCTSAFASAKCTAQNAFAAVPVAFLKQTHIDLKATTLTIGKPAIACPYALQPWNTTNGGGEALLKYTSAKGWVLVTEGGGSPNVSDLVMMGIPKMTAQKLIQARNHPFSH